MSNKKYTLCFKGKNKYGHECVLPIVSLDLKTMDEYTSRYTSYGDLFSNLPDKIVKFIKKNLGYDVDFKNKDDIENYLFIEGEKYTPEVVFKNCSFVLNNESNDLTNLVIGQIIGYDDYQKIYLKSRANKGNLKRYEFFKYLYEQHVRDKKIMCMIDIYDTKEQFPFLKDDELMIASIATDKDNIKVILKKLCQTFETRRDLLLKIKDIDNKLLNDLSCLTDGKDISDYVLEQINKSFHDFEQWYEEEYETKSAS